MAYLLPKFTDPVEEATKIILDQSHLENIKEFVPIVRVDEIEEGHPLPFVTCETINHIVAEDGVNARVSYLITIWDYFPDIEKCETEQQTHLLAVQTTKSYMEDLLSITNAFVDEGLGLFPDADYEHFGERIIRPRYKETVFTYRVDAKQSPMRKRLMGASIMGTLKGVVPYICCSTTPFPVE